MSQLGPEKSLKRRIRRCNIIIASWTVAPNNNLSPKTLRNPSRRKRMKSWKLKLKRSWLWSQSLRWRQFKTIRGSVLRSMKSTSKTIQQALLEPTIPSIFHKTSLFPRVRLHFHHSWRISMNRRAKMSLAPPLPASIGKTLDLKEVWLCFNNSVLKIENLLSYRNIMASSTAFPLITTRIRIRKRTLTNITCILIDRTPLDSRCIRQWIAVSIVITGIKWLVRRATCSWSPLENHTIKSCSMQILWILRRRVWRKTNS